MSRRAGFFAASALAAAALAIAAPAAAQTFSRTDHTGLFHPVAADFNGDGRIDLAGTTFPGTNAGVLINTGAGAYGAMAVYGVGGDAMTIAAGDLNNDARPDLVVTINNATIGLALLINRGDGTFAAPVPLPNTAVADSPSVVVSDFDNDGRQDIAVAHGYNCYGSGCVPSTKMSVLMGNGDGSFMPSRDFDVGQGMNRIAVGDFNKDGVRDMVVGASNARVYRLQGVGDGTFSQLDFLTLDPSPSFIEITDVDVADFNRDGNPDLVAPLSTNSSRLAVLIGNGDGTWRAPLIMQEALDVPQYVAVADYNGDGFEDLAYGFAFGGAGLFAIRNGNGDGTFQASRRYEVPPPQSSIGTVGMVSGHFNADTRPDLALAIGGAFPGFRVLLNTTGAAPPPALVAPTLLSPAQDAVVAQPVALDWSDVAGATSYRVQIDDTSDFSSTAVNQVLTASQYNASGLVAGRRYFWRARAINAGGNGPYSGSRRFTTQSGTAPPPPPPPPPSGDTATLTVSASGRSGERVQSSPAGINVAVNQTQSASFTIGTAITLSVTNGREAIWSGACSSNGAKRRTCAFTFSAASSVSANVQ